MNAGVLPFRTKGHEGREERLSDAIRGWANRVLQVLWRRPSGPTAKPAEKDFIALMISSSDTLKQFD